MNYFYLMRLHKPIGIFLLLWPTLWALWLASQQHPDIKITLIFILGVIVMRSAGCVINDFADRKIDRHVARTRERPLTSGKITTMQASILFFILMCMALILVLFLNAFTILLAFIGAAFAIVYPFLKRVTHLPQVGLGVAFAWGVPMAFAAQNNEMTLSMIQVFLAAMIWPIMYDTLYAMVDREDDLKINVKSTAILFNQYDRFFVGMLQLSLVILFWNMGRVFNLSWYYEIAVVMATLLFIYQQWLIKDREPKNCFKAFLNNNWVGMIIFAGILFS